MRLRAIQDIIHIPKDLRQLEIRLVYPRPIVLPAQRLQRRPVLRARPRQRPRPARPEPLAEPHRDGAVADVARGPHEAAAVVAAVLGEVAAEGRAVQAEEVGEAQRRADAHPGDAVFFAAADALGRLGSMGDPLAEQKQGFDGVDGGVGAGEEEGGEGLHVCVADFVEGLGVFGGDGEDGGEEVGFGEGEAGEVWVGEGFAGDDGEEGVIGGLVTAAC